MLGVNYPPTEVNVVMHSSQEVPEHDVSDDSSAEDEEYLRSVLDAHFTNDRTSSAALLPSERTSSSVPLPTEIWKETKDNAVVFILPQKGEPSSTQTPPASKLPQCDASTSTTLPISDSSSSQQRSSSTYNPYSHHSPGRSRVKTPLHMSAVSIDRSPGYYPGMYSEYRVSPPSPSPSHDDDSSSIDSSEALERLARKIRTELRHAEMVELAIEAERAAEAGEESFAAKPSTFGLDDSEGGLLIPKRRSYSEGIKSSRMSQLLHNRSNKIGILALRDIDEVFPSFRQFHTHMRTHFARSHVDEKTLVYYEKEAIDETELPTIRHRNIVSPQRLQREGRSFLQNFSLDKWVGRPDSMDNGRVSNQASVGNLLADHIHSPKNSKRLTSDIQLPGLELPEIYTQSMEGPSTARIKPNNMSSQTLDTTLIPAISEPQQQTPAVPGPAPLSPKALFDLDEELDSDTEDYPWSRAVLTPKAGNWRKSSPDFVTPARLRVIRNATGGSSNNVVLPLLPSSNTMIRETPSPPSSDHQFPGQPRTGESVNSLLLPTFRRRESNPNLDIDMFNGALWLKPSNSKDISEDRNGADVLLPADVRMPLEASTDTLQRLSASSETAFFIKSAPSTPPHDPVLSAYGVDREEANSLLEETRRVVKVSIFNRRKADTEQEDNERTEVLEPSQLIATDFDSKKDDSVRTPGHDCNCLTLSPASSLDSAASFPSETAARDLDNSYRSTGSIRKSTSAGNLQAEIERKRWYPCVEGGLKGGNGEFAPREPFKAAMDMIATLSPNHQMFLSKRSTLYVRQEANDEFLHNYMYCSKPKDGAIQSNDVVCAEPCQDANLMCGDLHMDMCCVSALADTAVRLGPRRTSVSSTLLSLSRDTSYSKLEPESWFDMANEHFDGVLEHLVGSAHHHGSQWNVSFQAPGLKKNPGSTMKPARADLATSSLARGPLETRDTDIDYSVPQPLFEAPQESLSDTQFQLIYGISREAFAAANRNGVSEQIQTTVTPPENPNSNADAVITNKSF
jgi:hypothetical protein